LAVDRNDIQIIYPVLTMYNKLRMASLKMMVVSN